MGPNLDRGQLERQQALLMERLRAADGAAVSFVELRAIGIENPALLCYELAAVGVPLTRTSSAGEGMPALSVRLERAHDMGDGAPEPQQPPPPTRVLPRAPSLSTRRLDAAGAQLRALLSAASGAAMGLAARARRARARDRVGPPALAAMLALAAVLAAVIAIAASHGTGGARTGSQRARAEMRTPRAGARPAPARPSPAPTTRPSLPIPLAGPGRGAAGSGARVSPAQAASLQAEGHQLLADGSYGTAIARLLGAIKASGQSLADCVEPASEPCLTFAYALYDLGRALRLQGDHAAAVAVLSERLRINDQRPVVLRELELARGASA